MKRLVAVAALCALLSIAAFALLVAADRRLGLPLPYSIPWSFATVSILAPAVFAIANAVRRRRPLIINVAPARTPAARAERAPVRPPVEGVVLLEVSTGSTLEGRAA